MSFISCVGVFYCFCAVDAREILLENLPMGL